MKKIFSLYVLILTGLIINVQAQKTHLPVYKTAVGVIFKSKVTYYGDMHNNRRTANGEIFSNDSLTCSHPNLPFNTIVHITNDKNGYTVTLRINDRGPNPHHPEMYVTQLAAAKLGMPRTGILNATIHIIGKDGVEMQEEDKSMSHEAEIQRIKNLANRDSTLDYTAKAPVNIVPTQPLEVKNIIEKENNDVTVSRTYDLQGNETSPQGYGVQLFSVDNMKTAEEICRTLVEEKIETVLFIQQGWVKNKKVYRILAGAAPVDEAKELAAKLKKRGHKGFIQKHITS